MGRRKGFSPRMLIGLVLFLFVTVMIFLFSFAMKEIVREYIDNPWIVAIICGAILFALTALGVIKYKSVMKNVFTG